MKNIHTTSFRRHPLRLCLSYLPCLFVYFLILWPYVTLTTVFAMPLMRMDGGEEGGESKLEGCLCLAVSTVTILLLLTAYTRCVATAPGYSSAAWTVAPTYDPHYHHHRTHHSSSSSSSHSVSVLASNGELRYCNVCEKYKPDLTHHCRHCERCVLHMDHHCPWINNCVGLHNHKYFLQFLFYIPVNGCVMLWFPLRHKGNLWDHHHPSSGGHPLSSVGSLLNFYIMLVFSAVVSGVLGFFFLISLCTIIQEETTLSRLTSNNSRSTSYYYCCCALFYRSCKDNIQPVRVVCGIESPWWHWFLPCVGIRGINNNPSPRHSSEDV